MTDLLTDLDRQLSPEEADKAFSRYPYFLYPQAKAFSASTDPAERELLRRRVAMNLGDPEARRRLLGIDPEEFSSFYPDMAPPSLSTADTIDTFLSQFGDRDALPPISDEIPVAAPAIDYAATFMADSEEESAAGSDRTSSKIDSFLKSVPPPAPRQRPSASKEAESPALTESLARVMIKNRNYRKALEIITELNLKNPEKSVYFADQIRFLRKLIINESKS